MRSPVGGKLLSYPIGQILTSLYKLGTTGEDFNADLAHQLEDEANNTLALSPFNQKNQFERRYAFNATFNVLYKTSTTIGAVTEHDRC
jgi:hypothetical protein